MWIVEYLDLDFEKTKSYFFTKKAARSFIDLYKKYWEEWKMYQGEGG